MAAANPGFLSRWRGPFLVCLVVNALVAAAAPASEAKPDPEALLGQALEIAAKDVNLLLAVARTHIATDRKDAARKTLQGAWADQEWRPKDDKIADKLREIALLQAEAGDRDGSAKTLIQVLDWADTLPEERHFRQRARTITTRMMAGDIDGAFQMLEKQPADQGRYAVHMAPYVRAGDKKTLQRTLELLFQEPEIMQRNHIPRLLGIQAAQGDVPSAVENAKRLGPHRWLGLEAIAKAQAQQKDWKAALETVKEIPSGPERAATLAIVAPVQFEAGEQVAANKTLAEAVKIAKDREKTPEPKADPRRRPSPGFVQHGWDLAWSEIARAQARMHDVQAAQHSAAAVRDPLRRSLFLDIARQRAAAGDRDAAKKWLQQARSLADEASPARAAKVQSADQFQASSLYSIAIAQADIGDYAGALKTADAILSGHLPDAVRERMVQRQTEAGDLAEALKLARTIHNAVYRGQAVMRVARAQARAGQADEALKWANELEQPPVRAYAYLGIVEGLAK